MYIIILIFNKRLSKYLKYKKRANFQTSTKEKMNFGHENRYLLISIVSYYIFYFSEKYFNKRLDIFLKFLKVLRRYIFIRRNRYI